MKILYVILDGAADVSLPELGGRTPLARAHMPALDLLAGHGHCGRVRTVFPGLPVESLACMLGLLGYDPVQHYPGGRASCEAMAGGIALHGSDLALRCNLVAIRRSGSCIILHDFTANRPDRNRAAALLGRMPVPQGWELHAGQGYRNLLVIRNAAILPEEIRCAAPHMHEGEAIRDLLPRGQTVAGRQLASELSGWMQHSLLPERIMPWVWSPSRALDLPPLSSLTGLEGSVVAGLQFMQGLAMACGMHFIPVPGATGEADTNLAGKCRAVIHALALGDLVLVHINAPDETAHQKQPFAKIAALEAADRHVLLPLLDHLRKTGDAFRIIICADHTTRCTDGRHDPAPPPFVYCTDEDLRRPCRKSAPKLCEESVGNLAPVPSTRLLRLALNLPVCDNKTP